MDTIQSRNVDQQQMDDYYNSFSREYFDATSEIDPTPFLAPFIGILPRGATVLDVGCGSGRDLLWMKKRGFIATGFERAGNLAQRARTISGCPVLEGDFFSYDFSGLRFDALLLVAALVHVERSKLRMVLKNICNCLVQDGHILLSLKEGRGEVRFDDGRNFTLWSETELTQIFSELRLEILDFSQQVSRLRESDVWLQFTMQKKYC